MFAHLNVHSYYSMGWGASSPEKLCQAAVEMGCKSLALTDINSVYGLFFFLDYAREFNLHPIIGSEIVSNASRATLLVMNRKGYSNLCHIITNRHIEPDFDLHSELEKRHDGLVILSNDTSILTELNGKTIYLFAELIAGHPVRELLEAASNLNIKPVATNRAFWIEPDDQHLHKLLRTINLNTTLDRLPDNETAPVNARLLNEQEMRDAFSFCPEAVDNTLEVADLCNWTPDFGVVYPELEPGMNGNAIDILRERIYRGAAWKYTEITPKVTDRIEHELDLIKRKQYAPIFLVVEDIVKQSPRTCGRGSAAASIVSYCLGITHVDPIRHKLFFERFINEARSDPPDIDVDFAWDERDDVLDYVFNKYGIDRSAMVSNHVSFQKKSAVHEIAKVYGLPEAEITAVTKRMSYGFKLIGVPITEHLALLDHGFPPPWDDILKWSEKLEDIPRYISVHCGGVVITPGQTADWVPTEIAAKGVRILQWEKDQTEDSGLVKIDLLGNRSLAVIRDTINAVNAHYGLSLEYATLYPLDDPDTKDLISRGDTMGVFYVESPATRLLQKKAGTGDYEHLVLHSSIIRPAANPFINEYLRRLKGESWKPLHPLIGDILDDNYGIMVYQEDVTRVAMKLAGFNLADAEELRKIISKKHKHRRLLDLRKQFYDGASQRGVSMDAIDKVWDMIMSFAGYSFCKPHSASYALVSFKSAFLRAHYPAEFMAGVISNQGGFYATFAYVSEAKRMGLRVLPPDINESDVKYTGRDDWIRVGLMQIKGLNLDTMQRIVDRRSVSFRSFEDCLERAELTPSEARLLVKAGCFDRLEPERTRPELLWQIALSVGCKTTISDQESLFSIEPEKPPRPPEYNEKTILQQEVETLGFLISRHPLELYTSNANLMGGANDYFTINRKRYVKACALEKYVGKRIEFVGWLVTGKIIPTKNREAMEFVTFEDTTGLIETVFFPRAFKQFSHM
ncbi:MAG: DNA polymerase III subunit alpha, partial [Calditrichaeota bacterium]|nr:DNA polymerase III subunit alpha [Calditrichota bacterium]